MQITAWIWNLVINSCWTKKSISEGCPPMIDRPDKKAAFCCCSAAPPTEPSLFYIHHYKVHSSSLKHKFMLDPQGWHDWNKIQNIIQIKSSRLCSSLCSPWFAVFFSKQSSLLLFMSPLVCSCLCSPSGFWATPESPLVFSFLSQQLSLLPFWFLSDPWVTPGFQ